MESKTLTFNLPNILDIVEKDQYLFKDPYNTSYIMKQCGVQVKDNGNICGIGRVTVKCGDN